MHGWKGELAYMYMINFSPIFSINNKSQLYSNKYFFPFVMPTFVFSIWIQKEARNYFEHLYCCQRALLRYWKLLKVKIQWNNFPWTKCWGKCQISCKCAGRKDYIYKLPQCWSNQLMKAYIWASMESQWKSEKRKVGDNGIVANFLLHYSRGVWHLFVRVRVGWPDLPLYNRFSQIIGKLMYRSSLNPKLCADEFSKFPEMDFYLTFIVISPWFILLMLWILWDHSHHCSTGFDSNFLIN